MLPTFCLEGEGCYHDDEVDGHLLIKFFRLETGADRVSECRKAGGVVCQLWLGGVRGRHQALPTPPLLHWSTTTWRSNVQQAGRASAWCSRRAATCWGRLVLRPALLPGACPLYCAVRRPYPPCAAPLHFSVHDLVLWWWWCHCGVVHLDSRNVRNRVTVLHVLPPTIRVAHIILAMTSCRGSVCDRCACPDLAYGIIGQGSGSLPTHQQHGSGQEESR